MFFVCFYQSVALAGELHRKLRNNRRWLVALVLRAALTLIAAIALMAMLAFTAALALMAGLVALQRLNNL